MINLDYTCAVKRRWTTAGESPARELGRSTRKQSERRWWSGRSGQPDVRGHRDVRNRALSGRTGARAEKPNLSTTSCAASLYTEAGRETAAARSARSKKRTSVETSVEVREIGMKVGARPQGSPISPLLSNLYMRRFVLGWKKLGHEKRLKAYIVNYADDLVICSHGKAADALVTMREMMSALKLTVNETKTRVCTLPEEKFDFLGYTFGRCYSRRRAEPISARPRPRNGCNASVRRLAKQPDATKLSRPSSS